MSIVEFLVGPSGAYLLGLLGLIGLVLLVASAAHGRFQEMLVAFAVFVGGVVLGVCTHAELFAALSIASFFAMVAFGVRRLIHEKRNLLLAGVVCSGGAVLLFIFRAVLATFFGMG